MPAGSGESLIGGIIFFKEGPLMRPLEERSSVLYL
jgi:hypothetical protein